ncbi:MAG TPA: class I SAM-dependent methyltransferase [Bauldia sp.]|nr:class I SAM-dependent methyltransferase [Bauldia sp.]
MGWKEDVRARFSPSEDLLRWDGMYAAETENLEDEFFRLRRDFAVAYVAAHYGSDARICDLGCGAGPTIAELLKRGFDTVGFDYSPDMLGKAAKRIGGRRPLVRCDIQAIPLRDATIDCAVCLGVISYVERYDRILAEIHRILKPGGTAIVTYRNDKNLMISDPVGPVRYLGRKLQRLLGRGGGFRIGNHMSFAEVRRVVARSSLTLEGFRGIGFGPLRFNRKPILSERASLKLHRTLTRWFDRLGAEWPFRLAADVHILIVRKPPA